ncbi:nitrous oxide reductase accessory protein NosL [Mucilaginibacter sp. UR6-11]|uniref:nitrous oxide reductase accessory protein NosL n=1 Tax=Mucilaginibacter sp. UR6-11 TaxID=1435644 RepID=UPI002106517C|nr:nitrous oxide reductase accessory protein NosL [Mucilaginibacter sp. UR6-11]MCC8426600.1 nitrous oxide reductase accessory protein NosL [Mucilaginibacter sp. UR6-11]
MKTLKIVILLLCGLLAACSHAPEPIRYGKDACSHCKMTIMDKRFAAELINAKGKIFKFDAAECMAAFLKENPAVAGDVKSVFLVNDFTKPGQFTDARKSFFLRDSSLSSPMGGNLAAFISRSAAEGAKKDRSAQVFGWLQLLSSNK